MSIDILKFGFTELPPSESGVLFFEKKVNEITIELMVAENIYSLWYVLSEERVKVANRYMVETQEQFDFLILNGRVGWLFKLK